MQACKRCNGQGTYTTEYSPGKVYRCLSCDGTGSFAPPDSAAIDALILSTKGKNKGKLRSSFSSYAPEGSDAKAIALHRRAYYVWRMARFHGGEDTTMPFTATLTLRNDPYQSELDALADAHAKASFGSDLKAAATWGRALGML